ncbi:hypothetical protein H0H81_004628 [Sphagnurus paluster]|uniref:DUF6830 domain-containing protein n=1 Tax=Sphagnurus paluster TaxID=117069 RepID=A0A9P7K434_9AGAR|nr:hypothetical protein H0H81_004628 [Sphagnurus paluster]
MHTGKWWWSTQVRNAVVNQVDGNTHTLERSQVALEKDKPGTTIILIIISTDKTQLTLFRNKSAYPIYITIGNIPKEIRSKPSNRAYVLLGYLPTTRLENVTNLAARRRLVANLYHACMARILAPLESAGKDGVFMTTGDGLNRRSHPLLACVVIDYPEQVLTTCTITGDCPTCPTPRDQLGEYDREVLPELRDMSQILEIIDSFESDPAGFLQACKAVGVKPMIDPFWKNLPYVHIYRSITPDILHQLYQGIMKHLVTWIIQAYGAAEIDARCRRMPPNYNIRLFMKGISTFSRVTGQEHDQMCRILLGLVIDIPLPGGLSSARLLSSVQALLDFLYLAQYPVHTDETLELLEDALEDFHRNKQIFVDLEIRDSFNIPKLHWAQHYTSAIKLYGTTDNVNTQYTKRLHIDLAKDAYVATNHKDEFPQMTLWVEHKEKILRHSQHVEWHLRGSPAMRREEWTPPGLELDRACYVAKHPSARSVSFARLATDYGAPLFRTALAHYVTSVNEPNLNARQVERRIWTVHIPFNKVPVWHRIKFLQTDPASGTASTAESIHVQPAKTDIRGRIVPARFDTALLNDGTGQLTGIEGQLSSLQ